MATINALFPCFPNISPFIVIKSNGHRKVSSPFLQLWPKTTQLRIHQTLELNQKFKVPAQNLPGKANLINFFAHSLYGCHFKQHSATEVIIMQPFLQPIKSYHNTEHNFIWCRGNPCQMFSSSLKVKEKYSQYWCVMLIQYSWLSGVCVSLQDI